MVRREKRLWVVILNFFLVCVWGGFNFAFSQSPQASPPGAPPIGTWTQLPPGHREVDLKGACMVCHEYSIDATTSATKQMVLNGKRMEKEPLWNHIVELLGGGKRTKTMVLASSLHDMPLATVCGQMIDPVNKVLYAFYEIGTEKLDHLKETPHVSLIWHEPWPNDFTKVLSVQVMGKAKLFDASDPVFEEGLKVYFPSEESVGGYGSDTLKGFLTKIKKNMVMSRITIDQVIIFEGNLLRKGLCAYQMWRREDNFSPSSYTK